MKHYFTIEPVLWAY